MNWAKQNYDRLLLAVFAVVLLACAGLLFNNVRGYQETFAGLQDKVPQKRTLPVSVDPGKVTAEQKKVADPDTWGARMLGPNRRLPLFVSVPYIAKSEVDDKTGQTKTTLIDPYANGAEGPAAPSAGAKRLADRSQPGHAFPEHPRSGPRRRRVYQPRRVQRQDRPERSEIASRRTGRNSC